jgi:hypothetical protein
MNVIMVACVRYSMYEHKKLMVELDVEGDEEQAGRSCMFKYTGCP